MRLVATTVVRESVKGRQTTGYIYDVDWESGEFSRRPVPDPTFLDSDDNPRGGVRGGRGAVVTRHGIVVANYDTVHVYDDDWNLQHKVSHPLMVGMHELDWDGTHLWLTATVIDAVLRLSLDDDGVEVAWDPHAGAYADRLGLARRGHSLDGGVDFRHRDAPRLDHCHINDARRQGSDLVVNCGLIRHRPSAPQRVARRLRRGAAAGGTSAIVSIDEAGGMTVLSELADHDLPTHNGRRVDADRVIVNDSTRNTVRVLAVDDGRELGAVAVDGRWLRGQQRVDQERVIVGTAPARLVMANLATGWAEREVVLSDDPNEAVHGLVTCPGPAERV